MNPVLYLPAGGWDPELSRKNLEMLMGSYDVVRVSSPETVLTRFPDLQGSKILTWNGYKLPGIRAFSAQGHRRWAWVDPDAAREIRELGANPGDGLWLAQNTMSDQDVAKLLLFAAYGHDGPTRAIAEAHQQRQLW